MWLNSVTKETEKEALHVQSFTSRGHLCTLAAAAVIILILCAKHGAWVGYAAGPTCCTTETFNMEAGIRESK